jgi:hypothetical protein
MRDKEQRATIELPEVEGGGTERNEGDPAKRDDAPEAGANSAHGYIRATSVTWCRCIPHRKAETRGVKGQPTKPKVTGSNPVGRA